MSVCQVEIPSVEAASMSFPNKNAIVSLSQFSMSLPKA